MQLLTLIPVAYASYIRGVMVLTLILSLFITACNNDDEEVDPSDQRLTTGFIIVAASQDASTTVAKYYPELPTGEVDLTQGTSYQEFFPLSTRDGAMYMTRTDGSAGFAKMVVDGNQNFIEESIIVPQGSESFSLRVRDSEFGVFHDRNNANQLRTFNPTTMEVTGTLDMSGDTLSVPQRYQTFIFRGTDEIYAPMRHETGGSYPDVATHRATVSGGFTNRATFPAGGVFVQNRFGQRWVDEQGNIYFNHAGNLSFPNVPGAIIKIPAGQTTYDPTYDFKAAMVANPMNPAGIVRTFYYHENGIGYALLNLDIDPEIFQILQAAGGNPLTMEQTNRLLDLFFETPTGQWAKVDVNNQTVELITGLPKLSVFVNTSVTFIDNKPHFAIASPTDNAFYRYDPESNTTTEVFRGTGLFLNGVYDLSANE
ncbi:MAG: hypothetical protein AAGI38_19240 [Bacteroidota bacterium]